MRLVMRSRSVLVGGFLGGFAGAIALALVGCPASVPDVCSDGCGSDGASQDGPIVPPGCDLSKDPKDSIACVDDSIGLFVSAGGSDSNAGTKGSPLKTIGAALSKTSSQHARVYVCDGSYAEHVKITSTASIYGGFSCGDWSYDGKQGKVAPADAGYALDVENVASAIAIEDLEFDAIDGQKPGDSSIAIFVARSTGVTLRRVNATAGNGVSGTDPGVPSDAGAAPNGNAATTDLGGDPCINSCGSATSVGGSGGVGVLTGATSGAGADGGPSIAPNPPGSDGLGGGGKLAGCNSGDPGASAQASDAGATGSTKSGTLTASGWSSASGTPGGGGGVGQGGGGGSGGAHAGATNNGGGGGGGCGGCGGAGGTPGSSGGSSFALLIFQSTVTVDTCALTAGNGADGKAGGNGETGQLGGNPGIAATFGCPGGAGGNGGAGAGGGGGAGGNSIAIGYVGTKPTVTAGSQQEGNAGGPGAGGVGGAANNGLAGAAGTKADVQELP